MTENKLFNRNFTLLILGQISSLFGNGALRFALSMYILEQTGSATIFSSVLALALVPTVLLSPLGGILADRVNRRNIMVALDTLSGLAVLMAMLILPEATNDIGVIAGLMIVLSCLAAFESPTVQACVPQMQRGDNILRGNAMVSQVSAIAGMVTPFLGSVLYAAFGLRPVMLGTVVCFFLTAGFECFIRLSFSRAAQKQSPLAMVREDVRVSVHFLRHEQPAIVKLLLLAAVVSFFVAGTTIVGFPYLVRTVLGLSATHYGVAESAMSLAAILGCVIVAVAAARLHTRHLFVMILALGVSLLPAGAAFLLPLGRMSVYLLLLAMFAFGQICCSAFSTYAMTLIQGRTPEQLMGKVMSCVFTLSMCAQPVGQIIYGVLFDHFTAQPAWVLVPSGLAVCLIALASTGFFQRLEH